MVHRGLRQRARNPARACSELLGVVDIRLTNPWESQKSCTSPARACCHWRSSSVCSERRHWARPTHRAPPAGFLIRRSWNSRPPTLGPGGGASEGGRYAASLRAWFGASVTPRPGPVQRARGFGRGTRAGTSLRAGRLDCRLSEIGPGGHASPALDRRCRSIRHPRFSRRFFNDQNTEKHQGPGAKRRSTSPGEVPASQCRGPAGGACPSWRLAFQTARRSGATRGNRRMTARPNRRHRSLRIRTLGSSLHSLPRSAGRLSGRPVPPHPTCTARPSLIGQRAVARPVLGPWRRVPQRAGG
jgi:hypothetical protein